MVALDALVVTAALPVMGRDLHVGVTALQWTVDAHGPAHAAGRDFLLSPRPPRSPNSPEGSEVRLPQL